MRLVQATEAMERERDGATWTTWGGALPLEDYLARVQRLRNHPWSRAAMTTWMLCSEEGTPLTSCQAYRLDSRFGAAPGHAYGLSSVFTDPALRGQGLATTLLERLAERLVSMDPSAQACLLFSEVGSAPYARAGFQARPVQTRAFAARVGDPGETVDALLGDGDLTAALADPPWPDGAFALRPGAPLFDWQMERERILFEVLRHPGPPVRGARAGRGLAVWAGDPHRRGLALLLFQAADPGEAAALLESARRTALACALPQVLLWDGPEQDPWHLLPTSLSGEIEAPPGGALPMLRTLVPGLRTEDWSRIPEGFRI